MKFELSQRQKIVSWFFEEIGIKVSTELVEQMNKLGVEIVEDLKALPPYFWEKLKKDLGLNYIQGARIDQFLKDLKDSGDYEPNIKPHYRIKDTPTKPTAQFPTSSRKQSRLQQQKGGNLESVADHFSKKRKRKKKMLLLI